MWRPFDNPWGFKTDKWDSKLPIETTANIGRIGCTSHERELLTEEQDIFIVMQTLRQQGYSYEGIAQKLAQYHLRNRNGNCLPWENIRAILTRPKKRATIRAMLSETRKKVRKI